MMRTIYILIMAFFLTGCQTNKEPSARIPMQNEFITEALIEVNSYMVKRNHQHISNFIKRTGWEMMETSDGIWFEMLKKNSSENVMSGDNFIIEYGVRLINGDEPFGEARILQRNITLGSSNIETGLAIGLSYMGKGDSARIIAPPYLAYGNFGDSDKIPPDAILIFNVKIKKAD